MAFSVSESSQDGLRVLELRDDERGQTVKVLPEIGGTCVEYRVTHRGESYYLLEHPDGYATLKERASRYGTPILFPFPNRIRGGNWTYRGKVYSFPVNSGGNHIHGMVLNRPWEVATHRATEDSATCSLTFRSTDFDEIGEHYPFPFELMVTYTLADNALSMTFAATNVGLETMPMGVGFHPYFTAPISPKTDPKDCLITAPCSAYWELKELLPTGTIIPVEGKLDLRRGQPLEGLKFDDVFTGVNVDSDGKSRCIVHDKGIGLKTVVESDGVFREIVIYTPPGRRSICFEPYTCPTDAPNLSAKGMDVGLIELGAEVTFEGTMRVRAEAV
ncbi:MAG: aldose 1-epimerase [Candidatus Poribacteria bacterium]|nr:aldose 1-epimerase [Candidatus Poribacteria bacterium]